MNSFNLQPASIAALAAFILTFTLALYILFIKGKSKDAWLLFGFVGSSAVYFGVAVFFFSRNDFNKQDSLFWAHQASLALYQLSALPMAYLFRTNYFKKEAIVVFIIAFITAIATMNFHSLDMPLNFFFYLLLIAWICTVFIRKAFMAHNSAIGNEASGEKKLGFTGIFFLFKNPNNRDAAGFAAFALWSMLIVVLWINVCLMGLGIMPRGIWNLLHNIFILVSLVWLVTNYINYTTTHTTLLVKVIGLTLSAILLLMGLMGFLLFGNEHGEAMAGSEKGLKILAILVLIFTVIILIVFPFFFRRNLLNPLQKVIAGVQKVNAGDRLADVQVDVNDEIGYLAQHFNLMTASLRKYAGEMEELVAARTQALATSLDDLKAAQKQLIQSEKMASLGELTAGIAHEIQNPLNFVNNFSELNFELFEELDDAIKSNDEEAIAVITKDIKGNLEKISHHGKRADAIVKGMLQHSRANTGKKELTDINTLADEYLRLSYHGIRAKDKEFNSKIDPEFDESLGEILVVPQDLGRVFLNLFTNAFYAVTEKKKQNIPGYEPVVSVSTKKAGDNVLITVKDNGAGIAQKNLDKIFQPFFTTKPTGEGTGLGLSMSYDIVKAHGGEMRVESQPEHGSVFTIMLPSNPVD